MYAGELWLSARCASCGSLLTVWERCAPVDAALGRCSMPGHLHYQCTLCPYRGTVCPTGEEIAWMGEQLARRADGKPSLLPGEAGSSGTPHPSPPDRPAG